MAANKTTANDASVAKYLDAISDEARRADAHALAALMAKVSKKPATMWGPSIVGFGSYHYVYDSGREGDAPVIAFSARKSEFALYGLRGAKKAEQYLAKLGKHKAAKGCVYIKRLADIDLKVLQALLTDAFAAHKQ
jgi:hypothetical protein